MKTKRIPKWDNVKFILMVFVVVGHMLAYYTEDSLPIKGLYLFIYSFHMPAFVFVSGMMMKKTVNERRYDRIVSYLILGFLIKVVSAAAKSAVSGDRFEIELFNETTIAWYAFAMFVFAIAAILLSKFGKAQVLIIAMLVGIFAGYDRSVGTFLSISRIFTFSPFFFAGLYIDNDSLLDFSKKIWAKIVSAAVLIAVGIVCFVKTDELYWLIEILKGKHPYRQLEYIKDLGGLLRAGHYLIGFALVFAIIILVPNIKSFLTTVGSRTLSIYVFHIALIYIARDAIKIDDLLKSIGGPNWEWLTIIVALIIVFIAAVKPLNMLVNLLINPKRVKAAADGGKTSAEIEAQTEKTPQPLEKTAEEVKEEK